MGNRRQRGATLKEWLLLVGAVAVSAAVALAIIRWLAPQLLGVPMDLQMVRVSKEIPPFFSNVFREDDFRTRDFLLNDPVTGVRGHPLYPDRGESGGPHDVLGFRNRGVPAVADIVVLGDSQTYGNNVPLEENWPSQIAALSPARPVVYNMSVGGWGAVQYLEMFPKALALQPRVVIVALYSGNDPLESFAHAYGNERWTRLRVDSKLAASDAPKVKFPVPDDELWAVRFGDGVQTTFTPKLRLVANDRGHPAVRAGYRIMAEVCRQIAAVAQPAGVAVVFTVIPTKERVHAPKLAREKIPAPPEFAALVEMEKQNVDELVREIGGIKGARYADLVGPLQQAALGGAQLYPKTRDGHPRPAGYRLIAERLGAAADGLVPAPLRQRALVSVAVDGANLRPVLVTAGGVWFFLSESSARSCGWDPGKAQKVTLRDLAHLPRKGEISEVHPGPCGRSGTGN